MTFFYEMIVTNDHTKSLQAYERIGIVRKCEDGQITNETALSTARGQVEIPKGQIPCRIRMLTIHRKQWDEDPNQVLSIQ